ncbi:MAG TPA: transcriptional repressor [Phycisphaerae bacterium]|nr:transcriptional repressor [Phycisphaerae bacterium]
MGILHRGAQCGQKVVQIAIDGGGLAVHHSGMETPEQVFRGFLRQHALKFTTERLAILNAAQKFGRPFEAEELLLTLREGDLRTSKATIYRTLKHLMDAGLLKQVHFGGGKQAHYDFVNPANAHDHLLDLETGKIIPFSSELVVKLREQIAKKMGFQAVSHRFQIMARKVGEDGKRGGGGIGDAEMGQKSG